MADENMGGIYYEVGADVSALLSGARQAKDALADIEGSAGKASGALKGTDESAKKTGQSITGAAKESSNASRVIERLGNEVAVLAEQQDKGARSAAMLAAQLAAGEKATQEEVATIGKLAGTLFDARQKMDESSKAALQNAQSMKQAAQEYQRTESAISSLERNLDLAITEMESGSRAAAVLAAQLQAGAGATQEQRSRIELLAGSLYDMKAAQDAASKAASEQARQAANQAKSLAQEAAEAAKVRNAAQSLRTQIAILDDEQKNGARSAAMLSARLQAGSAATAAQRREIGELAGKLYDLKNAQDQNTRSSSGLRTGLTAIAAAISIAQVISYAKAFLETADAMTQLQARIDRLSPSAKEGAATFQSLAMIASQTGAGLQETTKLWEQLTTSLKTAGASNAQILSLTDTLQKIGRIGGSSTEEMSNALRQFGQSIASGTIRAEEFNSILEQMPELARQIATGLGVSVGELRKRMLEGKLSADDALNAIMSRTSQVNAEFEKLPRTTGQATNSLSIAFQELVKQVNDASGASMTMVKVIDSLTSAIDRLSGKTLTANQQMADLTSTGEMYARRARTWAAIGLDGWAEQAQGVSALSNKAAMLVGDLNAVTQAGKKAANNQPIKIAGSGGDDKEVQKLEKNTKRKLELSRIEGEARARLQAQYDAEDAGIKDSGRIKALQDEYAATERNTSARKSSNAEGKKSETQQAAINNKLEELQQRANVAATSTAEMSRQQTILRAEQSLGAGATQQQIQLAGEYAAKAYDNAAALKAQTEAEKKRVEAQKNYQRIQAEASPVTGIDNKFATDMQQLNQYAILYPQKIAEVEATRAAIEQKYRKERTDAAFAEWSQQNAYTMAAAAAFDSFGQTAGNALTGLITGSMTLSDALRSIGNNILSSVIDAFVQMGVEWLKSYIVGTAGLSASVAAGTAGAATLAAAWAPAAALASLATGGANAVPAQAGIIATAGVAQGLSVAGLRKNGGPVAAGSMYRVGEGGMPEIFQASNGNQYMIPGDNGSVLSNSDISSGGSGAPQISVYNYVTNNSSSAYATSTASSDGNGNITIQTIVADIDEGGEIGQAISRNYTGNRRATE
jgi:tape measure domain-containing protein